VDACPVDCIHPKKDEPTFADSEMLCIDPVECIDCGACVPVCPVSAIFAIDDLPEKWRISLSATQTSTSESSVPRATQPFSRILPLLHARRG